ncbi:hypothetical protein F4680DRAFT_225739 [Xylaria scruposa]|nr:hypothetical protein F4680DRAFT_225739 [Xylaria scruposa]
MASTIKETLSRMADHIPGFRSRRNEMGEELKPTDNLGHRYAEREVLREALKEMGFKDKEIRIWETESRGFDVNLPRELTNKEKETIFKKFEAAAYAKRAPPPGDDNDD